MHRYIWTDVGIGFFNNFTLPHLSEALVVFSLIKVSTNLLLLHSCVLILISEWWCQQQVSLHMRGVVSGDRGRRKALLDVDCVYGCMKLFKKSVPIQNSIQRKTGFISPKALLCASLCRMSIPEAYRNAHNQEKRFIPALKDCSVRKWKTH